MYHEFFQLSSAWRSEESASSWPIPRWAAQVEKRERSRWHRRKQLAPPTFIPYPSPPLWWRILQSSFIDYPNMCLAPPSTFLRISHVHAFSHWFRNYISSVRFLQLSPIAHIDYYTRYTYRLCFSSLVPWIPDPRLESTGPFRDSVLSPTWFTRDITVFSHHGAL